LVNPNSQRNPGHQQQDERDDRREHDLAFEQANIRQVGNTGALITFGKFIEPKLA